MDNVITSAEVLTIVYKLVVYGGIIGIFTGILVTIRE